METIQIISIVMAVFGIGDPEPPTDKDQCVGQETPCVLAENVAEQPTQAIYEEQK